MLESPITRRGFLRAGALGGAAYLLAGCSDENPKFAYSQTKTPRQNSPTVTTPNAQAGVSTPEAIVSSLPLNDPKTFYSEKFNYSALMRKHGLEPTIIPEQQWGLDRMITGANYLGKLVPAFEEYQTTNQLPTMGSLGAVHGDSYHVELSPDDTPLSVIKNFLLDIQDRKVILWGGSLSEVPYLLGTVNAPEHDVQTGWKIVGQIHANASFPFGAEMSEEQGTRYSRYTDLQVALKLIHEYTHVLQGRAALKKVIHKHAQYVAENNLSPEEIAQLMGFEDKQRLDQMNADSRIDRSYSLSRISFNEVQANVVAQSVLWVLNKMNGRRVPGTQDDHYPIDSGSLFRTFDRAIVKEKNHFDSHWLRIHNW